jgi:hypothetical protein
MTAGSSPLWEIDRLELVFFDAEFSRWQLFQEHAGVSSSNEGHRAHIQDVLRTLRKALTHLPDGTPFTFAKAPSDAPVTIKIKQLEWQRLGPDATVAWSDFVAAVLRSAQKDGLISSQEAPSNCPSSQNTGNPTPLDIKELLTNGLGTWSATLAAGDVECRITASAARDLISLLPVLPHWDLYGALRHGWLPFPDTEAPSASLWQAAGQCRTPFYCSRLIYLRGSNADAALRSKRLLGYSAAVEAMFADLAASDSQPVPIALREYYEYAFYPRDTKETLLYQFYALLLDRLQIALAGPPDQVKPGLAPSEDAQVPTLEELYYLAYPIFSGLGRRHFLHIYASPRKGSPPVIELWTAWEQLHRQLDWRELQHALIDELEQVEATRFQAHMNRAMNEKAAKNVHLKYQDAVPESVAANLHLLMPLQDAGFTMDRQHYARSWTYGPLISRVSGLPLGREWTTAEKTFQAGSPRHTWLYPQEPVVGDPDPVRLELIWADPQLLAGTSVQKTLAADRRRRLVAQQVQSATILWDAKTAERTAKEADAKKERESRRAALTGQRVKLLEQLSSASGSLPERFSTIEIEFNAKPELAKTFFGKHFYLEGLDPDGPDASAAWTSAYREIAVGSLHFLVSEYIETGAVQWLTHAASEPAQMKDVKTAHASVLERVNTALGGLDRAVYATLISRFRDFSEGVAKFIESFDLPDPVHPTTHLTAEHTTIRCTCRLCKTCTMPRKRFFRKAFKTMTAKEWAALLGLKGATPTFNCLPCVEHFDYINIIDDCFGINQQMWTGGLPEWAGEAKLTITVAHESHPDHSLPGFGVVARLNRYHVLIAKPSPSTPISLSKPPDALETLGKLFSPIGTASLLIVDTTGSVAAFRLFPKLTPIDSAEACTSIRSWCIKCLNREDCPDSDTTNKEVIVLSFDGYGCYA